MKNKILPFTYFVFLLGLLLTTSIFPLNSFGQNKSTSAYEMDWVELGPNNLSGETKAVLFDNRDSQGYTLYAGSAYGGLYISTNVGQTWNPVGLSTISLKISCITQTSSGKIYLGTGHNTGSIMGSGLYKSDDGINFTVITSTVPNFVSTDWWFINDVKFDETNNIIYAATDFGLNYSMDDGNTWAKAKIGDSLEMAELCNNIAISSTGTVYADFLPKSVMCNTGNPNMFSVIDSLPDNTGRIQFAVAPSNADIVYASAITPLGALDNFYRSDDGGLNWYIIAPGGSTTVNFYGTGDNVSEGVGLNFNVIEVKPNNPDIIMVGGINMWEGRKIDDLGFFQWEQMTQGQFNVPQLNSFVMPNHSSYKFRPGHDNEAVIGCQGGIYLALFSSSGNTFEPMHKNYYSTCFNTISMSGEKKRVIGGTSNYATILIDGTGNPVMAEYGIPVWVDGLGLPEIGEGGYCQNPIIDPQVAIYSLIEDQFRRTEDLGFSFASTFLTGAVETSIENITFAPTILWENFENYFSADSVDFRAYKNYNTGDQITAFSANRGYAFHTTTPVALAPGDSVKIQDIVATKYFIGGEDAVWMTTDVLKFGSQPEWFKITDSDNGGFEAVSHCIAISKDANYCWVGTEEGTLFRMSNIAEAYDYDRADVRSPFCIISTTEIPIMLDGGIPNTYPISSISVDPKNSARVLITLESDQGASEYVFKSEDALAQTPTFINIHKNLPQVTVYASLIDIKRTHVALLGTSNGIYMTENLVDSINWYQPNDPGGRSIFNTTVNMLTQQWVSKEPISYTYWNGIDSTTVIFEGTNNYGIIYAATKGKGAFYCDSLNLVGFEYPDDFTSSFNNEILIYPNPVNSNATLEYSLEKAGEVQIHIMDLNGHVVKTMHFQNQKEGKIKTSMNCSEMPSGTYIMHLISGDKSAVSKFIVVK